MDDINKSGLFSGPGLRGRVQTSGGQAVWPAGHIGMSLGNHMCFATTTFYPESSPRYFAHWKTEAAANKRGCSIDLGTSCFEFVQRES